MQARPVIVLDPGHGGFEPAGGSTPNRAAAHGLMEKDLALDLAERVRSHLSPVADVQLTRRGDVNLPLSERARVARDAGASAFVSLHFNASSDPSANETSAWIARDANPESRELAASLAMAVAEAAGAQAWGVGSRDLGVLLPSRQASRTGACLLEVVHLSNPEQAARLRDAAYRDRLARAIADALQNAPARRAAVHIPVLQPHQRNTRDTSTPNAVLRWNMDSGQTYSRVDVVVHLHGFVPKDTWIKLDNKDGISGIRFEHGARRRTRYTLGILPMGQRTSRLSTDGNSQVVEFPVLTGDAAGLNDLISWSLDWLAQNQLSQAAGSIQRARLILTAHSGGGARVERMLAHHDPSEIHIFDALYSTPTALIAWAERHIRADAAALAGMPAERRGEHMDSAGGALRCVYGGGTRAGSERLRDAMNTALAAISDRQVREFLQRYYRAESTTQGHNDIPRVYGPQVLTRNDADLEHPAPPARRARSHALATRTKEEILTHLRDCGLVPATVRTMSDYENNVLTTGTVFGRSVRLHPQFLRKVQAAETALGTTPHGVTSVSHYRNSSSTYHGWGLAIDLNPSQNPYIMHEAADAPANLDAALGPVYHRICWLMLGRASRIPNGLSALSGPASNLPASYLLLHQESIMIPVYFALSSASDGELQSFIDSRGTSVNWRDVWGRSNAPTPAELRALINADYQTLRGPQPPPSGAPDAPFKNLDPRRSGFLNLSLALVKALKDQGLRWGAIDLGGASGDIMHFDDGTSPLGVYIYAVKNGRDPSCPTV